MGRGGAREGAGRKRKNPEPLKSRNIRFTDSEWAHLKKVSGGNISEYVRSKLLGGYKMFDIEISGSIVKTYQVETLAELKEIAKRAKGTVSVAEGCAETFYGTPQDLIKTIEIAESYGASTLK